MENEHAHSAHPTFQKKIQRGVWIGWRFVVFCLEYVADGLIEGYEVMRKEAGLFWGVLFIITGLFGFRSGRYCDGNTADYLSCTRPAAYYYYDTLHIILLVIGIFLIMIWFLKQNRRSKEH